MIYNSRRPELNPAITKYDSPTNKPWKPFRPGVNRSNDWKPRHPLAWAEPIPTLLRGDDFPPPKRPEYVRPDPTFYAPLCTSGYTVGRAATGLPSHRSGSVACR